MLLMVRKVANVHIKVDGFVIRRLVREAESMKAFVVSNKIMLFASLVTEIMKMFTRRALNLDFKQKY